MFRSIPFRAAERRAAVMNRNYNSHTHEYRMFCAHRPALAYDGTAPFSEWQKTAREKLEELLGLPLELCDADFETEYEKAYEDYTEYRFTVQTEPGYYVPCHLLIPNNTDGKIPLTVCLSGHGSGMHIALGAAKNKADVEEIAEEIKSGLRIVFVETMQEVLQEALNQENLNQENLN